MEKTADMQIDLTDENKLNHLGVSAQRNISNLSDSILKNVRNEKLDHIIKKIKQTIDYIDGLCQQGTDSFFIQQKNKNNLKIKENYREAERRVDNMASELKEYQQSLLKNRAFFEMLEKLNRNYYKELEVAYNTGRDGLRQMDDKLLQMQEAEQDTDCLGEYLKIREQRKRIYDRLQELSVSREISFQISMQLRLLQENDSNVSARIQEVLFKTIMIWKAQVGIVYEKGIVTDHDKNELLKQNLVLKDKFSGIIE